MAKKTIPEEERVYIVEAAAQLDRRPGTLRKWDDMGILPLKLRPRRGKRSWRYWTKDQIEDIKKWMEKTDRRPGKGLEHIRTKKDPVATTTHIHNMRKPRVPARIKNEQEAKERAERESKRSTA